MLGTESCLTLPTLIPNPCSGPLPPLLAVGPSNQATRHFHLLLCSVSFYSWGSVWDQMLGRGLRFPGGRRGRGQGRGLDCPVHTGTSGAGGGSEDSGEGAQASLQARKVSA